MGILDNLKNVLGGKKQPDINAPTAGPSQILREHGLDPSGLKFKIGADGVLTVQGSIKQESDRKKITDILHAMDGVSRVLDQMTVKAGITPKSSPPEKPVKKTADDGIATYTVKSGDTLWTIAKQQYGDGSKYLKIFEANKGLLKDPDHIYPGQKLEIPPEHD